MTLSQDVKQAAHRLGFQLAGITTPDPPPHFSVFENWLGEGRHGEMAYLDSDRSRHRRANPLEILPECKSILVLGMRYADPGLPTEPPRLHGRVAAYAWGDDYHEVLPTRLQSLVEYIESRVGRPVPNRWYTDTGPILERDLAQRAGLGWAGKNTCLIDPASGSYYLLAEILLGIELDPDPPLLTDHCGTCTRCIEACPTACILPDRTLDAQRCISYLTIELKGPMPEDLRPQVGSWVFGCDICQQVCPWNVRFSAPGASPALPPRPEIPQPDLLRELSLTQEEFSRKFKGSPVKRAKRRGYLRNVAIALGNTHDPAAIPALTQALRNDPEPLVRGHAAWALAHLLFHVPGAEKRESVLHALHTVADHETEPYVLTEIHTALRQLTTPPAAASPP